MGTKKLDAAAEVRRRRYTDEFKDEAAQMLLDGHSGDSIATRLGLSGANLIYRWKRERISRAGPVADTLPSQILSLDGGNSSAAGQGGDSNRAKGKPGRMSRFSRGLEPDSSSSRMRTLAGGHTITRRAEGTDHFTASIGFIVFDAC